MTVDFGILRESDMGHGAGCIPMAEPAMRTVTKSQYDRALANAPVSCPKCAGEGFLLRPGALGQFKENCDYCIGYGKVLLRADDESDSPKNV
jgi:DnaJ-class molecular chaperone